MTYVNIGGLTCLATISGKITDRDWDNRSSKSIKLVMSHDDAINLWVDDAEWSIVTENVITEPQLDEYGMEILDENGMPVMIETVETEEFDNSEYCVAGDIIDHRDGYITVKMGKPTELENVLEMLLGGDE